VEGLCKELFPNYVTTPEQFAKWVKGLRAYCESWTGFSDPMVKRLLFNRVLGFLGSLRSSGEKDTLVKLVAEGAIQDRHVKAWGRLRNQAAHASVRVTGSLQELVDLCQAVTVLTRAHAS